jgi:hypothetical protein
VLTAQERRRLMRPPRTTRGDRARDGARPPPEWTAWTLSVAVVAMPDGQCALALADAVAPLARGALALQVEAYAPEDAEMRVQALPLLQEDPLGPGHGGDVVGSDNEDEVVPAPTGAGAPLPAGARPPLSSVAALVDYLFSRDAAADFASAQRLHDWWEAGLAARQAEGGGGPRSAADLDSVVGE